MNLQKPTVAKEISVHPSREHTINNVFPNTEFVLTDPNVVCMEHSMYIACNVTATLFSIKLNK